MADSTSHEIDVALDALGKAPRYVVIARRPGCALSFRVANIAPGDGYRRVGVIWKIRSAPDDKKVPTPSDGNVVSLANAEPVSFREAFPLASGDWDRIYDGEPGLLDHTIVDFATIMAFGDSGPRLLAGEVTATLYRHLPGAVIPAIKEAFPDVDLIPDLTAAIRVAIDLSLGKNEGGYSSAGDVSVIATMRTSGNEETLAHHLNPSASH